MARYYVEKDGEWNIFSTIIDDFLFDEFICLDALKARLLYERFKELTEDMDSLLTNNRRVNVMTYSEAIERKRADTPQTEMDKCYKCKWWNYSYGCSNKKGICDFEQADTPQTECDTCKHYKLACELFSEVCKYEPTTQTETQNSNLTFDTPQTERPSCETCRYYSEEEYSDKCDKCVIEVGKRSNYEPQTDCGWK